jgi:hypothetical protein
MTGPAPAAWLARADRLLEPSISYALGAVLTVTPEHLPRATPCREWDLRMLLRHACESLAALCQGIETGRVDLDPGVEDGEVAGDPARAFGHRAYQLLDAWTGPGISARSSRSPAARWRPGSWWPRQPSRSPSTGGTYPGRAGSASRSRARWPSTCWRWPPCWSHAPDGTPCSRRRSLRLQRPAPATSSLPSSGELPGHSAYARPPLTTVARSG